MNTDIVLDFLVDYYIWFIVGGLVLLVAIIGFIADKKKLFPGAKKEEKQKIKKQKTEKSKKDTSDIWDLDDTENSNENDNNTGNDSITTTMNSSTENLEQKDEIGSSNNYVNSNYAERSNNIEEYTRQEDYNSINEESSTAQDNYINDDYYDESRTDKYEQSLASDTIDNIVDVEQIKAVEQDIDKIDDMFASNNKDNEEISVDERDEIDYKNIGDDPNQTLQVNYSQLKEMVEDIIAETQNEHYKNDIVRKDEPISDSSSLLQANDEGIKDIPLPNLDHIAVDTIKQQDEDEDEDEDDVWKF